MKKNTKEKDKKRCFGECKKEIGLYAFYKTDNPMFDGTLNICKNCIKQQIDYDDMETVYEMFRQLNIKFDYKFWESASESKHDSFGAYLRMTNLPELKGKTWKDSDFGDSNSNIPKFDSGYNKSSFVVTPEMEETWGYGYEERFYEYFEKKYNFVKANYPEKTALHTESLKDWIKKKVREDVALAEGNTADAKIYGDLANKAAIAAKINPNQLTEADLSDGLDTFSQLVIAVEKAVDIIPILPRFKEKPEDKVDFTLLCYINYIRDLKGLPLATYPEIYKFYEDRKKENSDELDFLNEESEEE